LVQGNCWRCCGKLNKGKKRLLESGEDNPEWTKSVKREFLPLKATACVNNKTETHIGVCPECGANVSTIVSLLDKEKVYLSGGLSPDPEISTLEGVIPAPDPEVVEKMKKAKLTSKVESYEDLGLPKDELQEIKVIQSDDLVVV